MPRISQYERALYNPRLHEELLNKAVKGKKTRRGFAMAIYRVWCKMAEAYGQDPKWEVFCKKGHDCPANTYHVAWESMPYELSQSGMMIHNEYFYGEHYWSFSIIPYEGGW